MGRREASRETKEEINLNERGEERTAQRVPMSSKIDVLKLPSIPGYHCHWFNDKPGKIYRAQQAGYEFINEDFPVGGKLVGSTQKSGSCLTKDVGGGTTAYAMMLPLEDYEADQKIKAKKNANQNASVHNQGNQPGFYDGGTVQENSQRTRK